MFKPTWFFKEIKDEKFSSTFLYFIFIQILSSLIYVYMLLTIMNKYIDNSVYFLGEFFVILVSYALFVLSFLVNSRIYHAVIKLIGGASNYNDTFKAFVYGFMPTLLLNNILYTLYIGSLPIVLRKILSVFIIIIAYATYYGIYVLIKSTAFYHKIPAANLPLWLIAALEWLFVSGSCVLFMISSTFGSSIFAAVVTKNPDVMKNPLAGLIFFGSFY